MVQPLQHFLRKLTNVPKPKIGSCCSQWWIQGDCNGIPSENMRAPNSINEWTSGRYFPSNGSSRPASNMPA